MMLKIHYNYPYNFPYNYHSPIRIPCDASKYPDEKIYGDNQPMFHGPWKMLPGIPLQAAAEHFDQGL